MAREHRTRVIFHVDLDAFYASVEQHDNPELAGRPVIVGGLGRRGVVAAASYEARRHGVHSAMPMRRARQLCPDAQFLRSRMGRYRVLSGEVFDCFRALTPKVEGLSLDEAFLDLTADPMARANPEAAARALRERIRERTGLTASIGIAPNKLAAKLASDLAKPDGLIHVSADGLHGFLDPLPVERLWGVGPRTARRLRQEGIATFGGLRRTPEARLRGSLGREAPRLIALASGEDERPVRAAGQARSISTEHTFEQDLTSFDAVQERLAAMAEEIAARLRAKRLEAALVAVKLRTPQFRTESRQQQLATPSAHGGDIRKLAVTLAERWWAEEDEPRLRLLGVAARDLGGATQQLDLFPEAQQARAADELLDRVNQRFGPNGLRRGTGHGEV